MKKNREPNNQTKGSTPGQATAIDLNLPSDLELLDHNSQKDRRGVSVVFTIIPKNRRDSEFDLLN